MTTQTNTTQENINKKIISIYDLKIVKIQNLKDYNDLNIEISINKATQELLKKEFCVLSESIEITFITEILKINRYKAKGYLLRELYSNYKYLFCSMELIDTQKIIIPMETTRQFNSFLADIQADFKRLIQSIRQTQQINYTLRIEA